MAYSHTNSKGTKYYLNSKDVTLKGGRVQTIYFFSRDDRPTACELPENKAIVENARTGMLVLKNAVAA